MRGRFMGDVYYYIALPQGGEGRGVEKERQNIPFPLPLLGGGGLCLAASSRGGGWGSCFCTLMLNLVEKSWIEKIDLHTVYSI